MNIRNIIASLTMMLSPLMACSQSPTVQSLRAPLSQQQQPLVVWGIEEVVNPEHVGEIFTMEPITDDIFARMDGKSYKKGCTIPLEDLMYLRIMHHDGHGQVRVGEMVCAEEVAEEILDIFRTLYQEGYPIERMVLIDEYNADDQLSMKANNTSCFNYRTIAGTKKLSNHSYGKAVDINPLYNPWVKERPNGTLSVDPEEGRPYSNRKPRKTPYPMIDTQDLAYQLFRQAGFDWGGSWNSSKDYQHFEKKK